MAWLEAATNFLATLSYKLIRGDSGEGGGRRRETQHNNYNGTEWNSQQYPSAGSQDSDYVYGHGGGEYYGQGGSEKQYYRGNPQEEQRYSFHIRDQNGESEVNVVTSQRVEKKGGAWRTLCRRIDYEESGMRTKQYVDSSGKPVVEQTPYRSRMYEENQYIPFEGEEEDTGMNAAASVPRELAIRKRKQKRW